MVVRHYSCAGRVQLLMAAKKILGRELKSKGVVEIR
jgi:hypothetical protein